uniref:Uncharacterized protein n=1 Tax=Panagrolaimus superbus TaxID=310955 RepID=A0A914YZ41_9BILA
MQKLDVESSEVLPESLNLFSSKQVLVAHESSAHVLVLPSSQLGSLPIMYKYACGNNMIDLRECLLSTSFKIVKKQTVKNDDGTTVTKTVNIDKNDKVAFLNGFGATFIKNLKLSINGRMVYNSNDLYAFTAYFHQLLNLNNQNSNQLQAAGFYKDSDESQISGDGFDSRADLYKNDGQFDCISKIYADIMDCPRYLLSNQTLEIELTPNNNHFLLINNGDQKTDYHVQILDSKLFVKNINLIPQLSYQIEEKLNAGNCVKMPFDRHITKAFYINPGRYTYDSTLHFSFIPKIVFAALVPTKDFHGTPNSSPFKFSSSHIQSIRLSVNGRSVPSSEYTCNFTLKKYGRVFYDLIAAAPHALVNLKSYANHSTIFAFDMRNTKNPKYSELQRVGPTAISLEFNQQVEAGGLQLITLSIFENPLLN